MVEILWRLAPGCPGRGLWIGARLSPDRARDLLGPVSRLKKDLHFIFRWWKSLLRRSKFRGMSKVFMICTTIIPVTRFFYCFVVK